MSFRPRPRVTKTSDREGAERQCLACRERASRDELVRLVRAPDGTTVVDLKARLPGRGAWVHGTGVCLRRVASKPGLLARAFRADARVHDLEGQMRSAVEMALRDGLSLAAAAGDLIGGHDALVAALHDGRVIEVALASDLADRSRRSLEKAASDRPMTSIPLDRIQLGEQVGSGPRAAVGIVDSGATVHLRRQLQRLRRLG